jgi:hypothetical protein
MPHRRRFDSALCRKAASFRLPSYLHASRSRDFRSAVLGTGVIAVGGFEASLNVELDGTSTWAGHVHLVVAGTDRQSLKREFQIEKHHRSKPYLRPVDVRAVDDLGRQLGYSLKRIARRRVAYIDGQGRQNRNQSNLSSSEQREFGGWLLGLPIGARTILIDCRAHAGQLRLVNGTSGY